MSTVLQQSPTENPDGSFYAEKSPYQREMNRTIAIIYIYIRSINVKNDGFVCRQDILLDDYWILVKPVIANWATVPGCLVSLLDLVRGT